MEDQRQAELKSLQDEQDQLKKLVEKQKSFIEELEQQLQRATTDNTALQRQQRELENTVNNLIHNIAVPTRKNISKPSHVGIWE